MDDSKSAESSSTWGKGCEGERQSFEGGSPLPAKGGQTSGSELRRSHSESRDWSILLGSSRCAVWQNGPNEIVVCRGHGPRADGATAPHGAFFGGMRTARHDVAACVPTGPWSLARQLNLGLRGHLCQAVTAAEEPSSQLKRSGVVIPAAPPTAWEVPAWVALAGLLLQRPWRHGTRTCRGPAARKPRVNTG